MLSRRRGHTTAAIRGVKESGAIFVTLNSRHADQLRREHQIEAVYFEPERMHWTSKPLVFDHLVVEQLYYQLQDAKAKLREAEGKLAKILSIVS